jgi:hypothetical protein
MPWWSGPENSGNHVVALQYIRVPNINPSNKSKPSENTVLIRSNGKRQLYEHVFTNVQY